MAELDENEREHIRLEEEYRAEVQRTLRETWSHWSTFLMEKIALPVGLLVLTALLSGLIVPYILRIDDDQRALLELKTRLINEVVGESTSAQMELIRINEQQCDYWNAMLTLAVRKRLIELRYDTLKPEERQAEFSALADEHKQEYAARLAADKEYAESRLRLSSSTARLRHTITLYFEDRKPLEAYLASLERDHNAAETLVDNTNQDAAAEIVKKARPLIAACSNEEDCNRIVSDATAKIEKLRDVNIGCEAWQKAANELALYVAKHDPAVGSRAALAGILAKPRSPAKE